MILDWHRHRPSTLVCTGINGPSMGPQAMGSLCTTLIASWDGATDVTHLAPRVTAARSQSVVVKADPAGVSCAPSEFPNELFWNPTLTFTFAVFPWLTAPPFTIFATAGFPPGPLSSFLEARCFVSVLLIVTPISVALLLAFSRSGAQCELIYNHRLPKATGALFGAFSRSEIK